jgi:hypothetical protein
MDRTRCSKLFAQEVALPHQVTLSQQPAALWFGSGADSGGTASRQLEVQSAGQLLSWKLAPLRHHTRTGVKRTGRVRHGGAEREVAP